MTNKELTRIVLVVLCLTEMVVLGDCIYSVLCASSVMVITTMLAVIPVLITVVLLYKLHYRPSKEGHDEIDRLENELNTMRIENIRLKKSQIEHQTQSKKKLFR